MSALWGGAASQAAMDPSWVSPEDLLRQLVEEHGDTSFVFRRSALGWERTGEWVDDSGTDDDHGQIRDVKSKKR